MPKNYYTKVNGTKTESKDDNKASAVVLAGEYDARRGLIYDRQGLDIESYKENPVLLEYHDSKKDPLGKITDIGWDGDNLKAEWEWNPHSERAMQIKNMWNDGFLNAVSTGLDIPYSAMKTAFHKGANAVRATESVLKEISIVAVPNIKGTLAIRNSADEPIELDDIIAELGETTSVENAADNDESEYNDTELQSLIDLANSRNDAKDSEE